MTTTCKYADWNDVERYSLSLLGSVEEAIGNDYDAEFIEVAAAAYRAAINAALPASVSLCGDEFYGPYVLAECDFEGYPLDADGDLDFKAIVDGVDFWAIVSDLDDDA